MEHLFSVDLWNSLSWLQTISASLTIIAIPYAILYSILRLFYKVRHKTAFIISETYHQVVLVDHPGQPQSFWVQVMVKNLGFEVSRGAETYLSEIWKEEKGRFSTLKDFKAPVKLKWSHEADIYPIDILPRESRRLDVCFTCEGEQTLYLMAKGFPSGSIKNTLDVGNYIFILTTVSQNAIFPERFLLSVKWDGAWRSLEAQGFVKSFRCSPPPTKSFRLY